MITNYLFFLLFLNSFTKRRTKKTTFNYFIIFCVYHVDLSIFKLSKIKIHKWK